VCFRCFGWVRSYWQQRRGAIVRLLLVKERPRHVSCSDENMRHSQGFNWCLPHPWYTTERAMQMRNSGESWSRKFRLLLHEHAQAIHWPRRAPPTKQHPVADAGTCSTTVDIRDTAIVSKSVSVPIRHKSLSFFDVHSTHQRWGIRWSQKVISWLSVRSMPARVANRAIRCFSTGMIAQKARITFYGIHISHRHDDEAFKYKMIRTPTKQNFRKRGSVRQLNICRWRILYSTATSTCPTACSCRVGRSRSLPANSLSSAIAGRRVCGSESALRAFSGGKSGSLRESHRRRRAESCANRSSTSFLRSSRLRANEVRHIREAAAAGLATVGPHPVQPAPH
jgi:hypothetical protein